MENFDKKEIVDRMLSRAETGLYFLEDFLFRHSAKDAVYFRSILIILSYSFELVLKAKVVLVSKSIIKDELERELKKLNHNIINVSNKLTKEDLNSIGIEKIDIRNTNDFVGYIIKTSSGKELSIEDFIDVRYDFMKNSRRDLQEYEKVKECVSEILNIIKKIKDLLPKLFKN